MPPSPNGVPYGTLDLMVLKTLEQMGPLHGYGIARRIEQIAQVMLALNQGTIYPALLRLEQKGWSHRFWQTNFGGDMTVIGRTMRLDGEAFTIVGVAPAGFRQLNADVYVPLRRPGDPKNL